MDRGFLKHWDEVILWAFLIPLVSSVGVAFLSIIVRTITVAVCFARYSIRHIFAVILTINVLALPIVWTTDDFMRVIFGILLGGLLLLILTFVDVQDPTGEKYMPPFVREQMRAQRKRAREKSAGAAPKDEGSARPNPVDKQESLENDHAS